MLVYRDRRAGAVEEHEPEREAHPERVDRRAALEQEAGSGRQRGDAREPEQAGAKSARLVQPQAAVERTGRQPRKPPRWRPTGTPDRVGHRLRYAAAPTVASADDVAITWSRPGPTPTNVIGTPTKSLTNSR